MKRKISLFLLMFSLFQLPVYADTLVESKPDAEEVIELNLLTDEEVQYVESISAINRPEVKSETEPAMHTANTNESYTYLGTFKLTAYCECGICNGEWVGYPTKLGTDYVEGRTIAVDSIIIPLGSIIEINIPGEGWHRYRAEDTGSAVKQKKIDIFVNGHHNCQQQRYNGYCEVRLVK